MKTPLKVRISADHPLLILMVNAPPNSHLGPSDYSGNARDMVAHWESLSELREFGDLQDYATIQIEGICDDHFRRVEELLPYAEAAGIPITLQTQTNNADLEDTMPFDKVRRFVDTYDCIVGLQLSEASHRTFVAHGGGPEYSMGRNARYARDIIKLAGEYGLFMSWQLMSENYAAIACSGDNELLFDTICEYGEYVIPMHEMNSEFAKYIDHLSAMGLWMGGATANWGVEPQSWYWSDAGYAKPGTCLPGSLEMPGELYSIMLLLGATAGATAYSIEPPWDIWPGEAGRHRFTDWIVPTFRRLVSERLIPSRSEVKATMPVAYHLPRCRRPKDFHRVERDLDFDHSDGVLVRAAYGVFDRARDAEIIPNDPRIGWIPVLPTKTPFTNLGTFDRVIGAGELQNEQHARTILEQHFPAVDRGEAWSAVVGPLCVAANSHENWHEPQSVKLSVPAPPTGVKLDGSRLVWDRRDGDREYRVWRLRDGTDECLTPDGLHGAEYALTGDSAPRDGDCYAVSARTSVTETIAGTLHLHQFVVLNTRESRRSPWIDAMRNTKDSHRHAEAIPGETPDIAERNARTVRCSPVEDLASPLVSDDDQQAATKHALLDALLWWKRTIEAEDVETLETLYAPEFRDTDNRTVESVGVTFRSILQKYCVPHLRNYWEDFGIVSAWRNPVVRLFTRDWVEVSADRVVVDVVSELWAGGGTELEPSDIFKFPISGRPHRFRMTWTRTPNGWKIAAMDEPYLRMEDIMMFRLRYQGW